MSNPGRPPRPVPFQGDLSKLPDAFAALKERPNWVCWRREWKASKKGVGKWDKPPFRSNNPQNHAKNNDPTTWGTYEQALAVFEAGHCDGIGFNLLGTDIAAFDIDKCRDPGTGVIARRPWPLSTARTPTRKSRSQAPVCGSSDTATATRRIESKRCPGSAVEVESYSNTGRYIVVTGNPLPGTWPHMADIECRN